LFYNQEKGQIKSASFKVSQESLQISQEFEHPTTILLPLSTILIDDA
jgi:hypothetical protein